MTPRCGCSAVLLVLVLCAMVSSSCTLAFTFSPSAAAVASSKQHQRRQGISRGAVRALSQLQSQTGEARDLNSATTSSSSSSRSSIFGTLPSPARMAAAASVLATTAAAGPLVSLAAEVAAELNEYGEEIIPSEDLPPMWIPLALGVLVAGGVGWLQLSLGGVMDSEAQLGQMSGARAAKQSARNRNMFKKK